VEPLPLTTVERAQAARGHYEERLRLLEAAGLDEAELNAARQAAKQNYLRELNEVMT